MEDAKIESKQQDIQQSYRDALELPRFALDRSAL
jgi:hypothetical protein